ncbi:MAG TPA: MEDS domain-containing protein [Chthoniobacterales bacterium]|nr:MEDS domain-containing protein [Chthoniobacterales bacterium]
MITESTTSEPRKTGISVIEDVPWGTHFCCFYETKQDLLETLVPYFKAGLESQEFCLWVLSQALSVEEAKHALAQAVPDLERHLAEGVLEIQSHEEWYLRGGGWDPQRVLQSWREKLNQTSAKGYAGLRAAGEGGWVQSDGWMVFREYEEQVNALIADQRSIILCTYSLTTSPGDQVFDVADIHQVAVARRNGSWELIETAQLKARKAEIKRLNEELEQRVIERTSELAKTNEELRREITERRRVEEELKQSERLLAEAQHLAHVGSWSLDLPSFTVTWSDELYRIFGVEPSEFDHSYEAVIGTTHPEDRDWLRSVIEGALKTHEPFSVYYRITKPAGEVRILHARGAVVTDKHGNASRLHGTAQDVTERKHAEEELKREKEILAKIFNNTPMMIGFVDTDGGVRLVNPEWERTIGWTLKELRDQKVDIFTEAYPDASYRQKVLDFVAAATGEWADLKIRVRDGHVIDAACAVVHLSDGTKVAIAQDITERKRAAEQLEEVNRQLRILSRQLFHIQEEERRHLARELHDEIGQTLTAAKINLKIIAPDVPAEIRGRLEDSIQLLDRLLRQVRELSLNLRPPLLDELGLVPTLRWLVDQRAQRAGLRIAFTTNVDSLEIDSDVQTACFRVAQEAITNIIRHSGAKNVAVELRREAERLWLKVRDDGAGFDPGEIQQRLAQHSTLGLVSMKERASLVRGGLEIDSAPGQGTEIRAWFPLPNGGHPSTPETA